MNQNKKEKITKIKINKKILNYTTCLQRKQSFVNFHDVLNNNECIEKYIALIIPKIVQRIVNILRNFL